MRRINPCEQLRLDGKRPRRRETGLVAVPSRLCSSENPSPPLTDRHPWQIPYGVALPNYLGAVRVPRVHALHRTTNLGVHQDRAPVLFAGISERGAQRSGAYVGVNGGVRYTARYAARRQQCGVPPRAGYQCRLGPPNSVRRPNCAALPRFRKAARSPRMSLSYPRPARCACFIL